MMGFFDKLCSPPRIGGELFCFAREVFIPPVRLAHPAKFPPAPTYQLYLKILSNYF